MPEYHPLTETEAMALAVERTSLFTENAELFCQEIGDGNLNLVFHIKDQKSSASVIIKQALPYAKVVGESWPLTLDRARIESEALRIQRSLCTELVPEVYCYIPELAVTIMEDLSDHHIMRRGLIEGRRYSLFAEHIGEFMANTLFYTSDLGMNQQEKKLQQGRFVNPELCKITEDLIFSDPYTASPNNNYNPALQDMVDRLQTDEELHFEVAQLRYKFLTQGEALLHGDLHTGSIFVTDKTTKVIDPEFAFYGPMGFDPGAIIANLILNYCGQLGWIQDNAVLADYRAYLLDTIQNVWGQFESHFRRLWNEHDGDWLLNKKQFQDNYMLKLFQDTAGFAGCKIVRRIVGLSHVADIHTIKDAAAKEQAERMALTIGIALIKNHRQMKQIGEIIQTVKGV
ncbi:S-methyl-5-thioribose kinase [Marinicrinis lubricantis]|uniref:Methylthioribose kinase n=1 Tax=Marinicrinis lubricantis TaxID=2086470 RepID=A0ABW1II77_9BACL